LNGELLPDLLKYGRFLGILRKASREKMPKNRMEKNRVAVFPIFVKQILSYCCVGHITKL
jgi:hypothetical protein